MDEPTKDGPATVDWDSPYVVPGIAYARWHRQRCREANARGDPLNTRSPDPRVVDPKTFRD